MIEHLRKYAKSKGHADVYVAAVNGLDTRKRATQLGFDGVMAYNYLLTDGYRSEPRRIGPKRKTQDLIEDFATQAMPGQQKIWERMAKEFGRDYLLATTPMQNMEPTLRPTSPMMIGNNPDLYRKMLSAAKETIARHGLRPGSLARRSMSGSKGAMLNPARSGATAIWRRSGIHLARRLSRVA